jgi:hypothetical protein
VTEDGVSDPGDKGGRGVTADDPPAGAFAPIQSGKPLRALALGGRASDRQSSQEMLRGQVSNDKFEDNLQVADALLQ